MTMPSVTAAEGDGRKVFQVTEITRQIRRLLEERFGSLWIEGEISNFRRQASGHCYFTLKDETAQISAVLFRGNQRDMRIALADGQMVRVFGSISVYEPRGSYQVIVRRVEAAGQGALQARFEALKAKLQAEGLFDASRKRALPLLPQHVGVVTSPTGAAIRDILNVVSRRFPNLHILLAPARVQGEGAASEIAEAIDRLASRGTLDVLIVGRGGGSLEDLWCFNEEIVARAIARCPIPVISAVGHEIDFTISDFVADVRAPTPSAAAELVVGRKEEFEGNLQATRGLLTRLLRQQVLEARNRLLHISGSPVMREPAALIRQHMQRVDALAMRMERQLRGAVGDTRSRLSDMRLRQVHRVRLSLQRWAQETRRLDAQIKALNPLSVLARGFSVTTDAENRVVRRASDVRAGARLSTRLAAGTLESTVTHVEEADA